MEVSARLLPRKGIFLRWPSPGAHSGGLAALLEGTLGRRPLRRRPRCCWVAACGAGSPPGAPMPCFLLPIHLVAAEAMRLPC